MNNINWKEGSVRVCTLLGWCVIAVVAVIYFILSFASNLPSTGALFRAVMCSMFSLAVLMSWGGDLPVKKKPWYKLELLSDGNVPLIKTNPWFALTLLIVGNVFYEWTVYYLPSVFGEKGMDKGLSELLFILETAVVFYIPHFIVYFIRAVFRYIIGGFLKPTR